MATNEQLFSEDAWLFLVDDTQAAVLDAAVTSPYSVVTTVEYVIDTGFSGVFVVSATDVFKALVVDALGTTMAVTGTLTGGVVTITASTTLSSGVFPISFAVIGAAPNASWYYTISPDVMETFTEAVGFTVVRAGVVTYGPSTSSSRHSVVRIIDETMTYPVVSLAYLDLAVEPTVDVVSSITATIEPTTHAIIGAQLGDLELDIGKSVPWVSFFVNNTYITDINVGRPRYWVIDWDKSFKTAKYVSIPFDFFTSPVDFRKAQFAAASASWNFADDDWVLFIDGHEALSCDTRSSPDDVDTNPFGSFLHREITRAEALTETWVSLPFFAFVRTGVIEPQAWDIQDPDLLAQQIFASGLDFDVAELNTATVNVGVPYYYQRADAAQQGLVRLVKVEALRDPDFDWTLLDTLNTPSADVKVQVVSYGYAHWINPDTTEDDGFEMRRLVDKVRPLPGFPLTGADATGTAGPYAYADMGVLQTQPGVGTSSPLLTPMYSAVFRDNVRDGVWYLPGELGTPPDLPPPPPDPPVNDNFADAIEVTVGVPLTGRSYGATSETGEPFDISIAEADKCSTWWKFNIAVLSDVQLFIDTELGTFCWLYTGASVDALTVVDAVPAGANNLTLGGPATYYLQTIDIPANTDNAHAVYLVSVTPV